MNNIYCDLLYLISCAINDYPADLKKIETMNLSKIYQLSYQHSVEAITYKALASYIENNQNPNLDELFKKWIEAKNKIIRKTILMDNERNQLFTYLDKHKIWYLPLKGIILSTLYPTFGMRQMADNDILFDGSYRQEVHDWFVNHGYHVKSYLESNHDEYHKKPIYNFEMHTSLFHETAHSQYYQYYKSLKNKLQLKSTQSFEYKMSDEDFYIYMIVHNFKHYDNSGIGIRSLLDIYVYTQAKAYLDHYYIKNELTKINLYSFEQDMYHLSKQIFNPNFNINSLTKKQQTILQEMFASNTYGTIENHWQKQIKKTYHTVSLSAKLKYLLKRIYPSRHQMITWCKTQAPFIYKHPWLMPLARIKRIIKLNSIKRKIIKHEFNTIRKIK